MSAKSSTLRGRARPVLWTISLILLCASLFTQTHATPSQPTLKKLDKVGNILENDASQWSCVSDLETGLIWEKKDPTSALHGHDSFIWYQPEQLTSGASRAHPDEAWADSTCYGFDPDDSSSFCNTSAYTDRVNLSNYCGYSDWRLPTADELLSLADPTRQQNNQSPRLDTRFFIFHAPFLFWTNSVNEQDVVLTVFEDDRVFANAERSDTISIRLVRGNSQ